MLSGANVVGYVKCSKQASKQLKEMATAAVTTGLTVRAGTLSARAGLHVQGPLSFEVSRPNAALARQPSCCFQSICNTLLTT